MHITQKGQVTIPKKIRDTFGFTADSEVEFIIENRRVYLKKKQGSSALANIRGIVKGKFTTEEIMKLTRK